MELGTTDSQLIATPEPSAPVATSDVGMPIKTIVLVLLGISALALFAGASLPRTSAAAETPTGEGQPSS